MLSVILKFVISRISGFSGVPGLGLVDTLSTDNFT